MANRSDAVEPDGPGGSDLRHPLLRCADAIEAALKDVADVDPLFAPTPVKAEALLRLTELETRLESLRMRVIAHAGDVAEADAAHSVGAWLAPRVRTERGPQHAAERLATDLRVRYPLLREALGDARANLDQARVITRSLNELRRLDGVTPQILTKAEEFLLAECARLTPRELKTLADAVLEHLDPTVFDDIERKRLEAELRRARAEVRLTMRRRGDGSTDLSARIPDSLAHRLKTYLDAFTSPRHTTGTRSAAGTTGDASTADSAAGGDDTGPGSLASGALSSRFRDSVTGERLPQERLMGEALCALLERYDPNRLPRHGGTATTLVITAEFDTLSRSLGVGTLPDGTRLAASDVRRLACTADLLPAILDSTSTVLDLGTRRRLFTPDQRLALAQAHPTCQASGCSIPSTWCEAHHRTPWSRGGKTDLANGMLLCAFHHQRIHDDTYLTKTLPNGDIRYARRR